MNLSSELILQFAKSTKDEKKTRTETTVYGTVVVQGDAKYVRLDGSDMLTPAVMAVDVEDGERVIVRLKNHTATITGNLSSPAVRKKTVDEINYTVDHIVDQKDLDVERERIALLEENSLPRTEAEETYATNEKLELTNSNVNTANTKIDNLLERIAALEERVLTLESTQEGDGSV